ncbi:hypothetical protein NDI54_11980 [Haloarcula sp. S1AR25-5A]|uniref:ArsR family transcriptional regulator n=1 Tax=Haloarcula terrestris TaxID=2950533 RepID=A0AAE4JH14_9EURY|nr:hypothetical protein [Haloarcula terrestris]MDS0222067.1 hypothetical protein [Haloarcula terrestris]
MADIHYQKATQVVGRWDDVFSAITAEPRRQLIVALLDAPPDETVPLPESAANPNIPLDPDDLRRDLYHRHLPKLADLGFITWDTEPLVAGRGPRFEEVAVVFECLQSDAAALPDSLVFGCERLEQERQRHIKDASTG